jgi:hypothetical protein
MTAHSRNYKGIDRMNDLPASLSHVSLKSIALELGMDRSHARRYVLNLGITPSKRRTADSGGQLTLTVSAAEAELIRSTRVEKGFGGAQSAVDNEAGFFYLIQLVPELDPRRIKLGFADNVSNGIVKLMKRSAQKSQSHAARYAAAWMPAIDFHSSNRRLSNTR